MAPISTEPTNLKTNSSDTKDTEEISDKESDIVENSGDDFVKVEKIDEDTNHNSEDVEHIETEDQGMFIMIFFSNQKGLFSVYSIGLVLIRSL